MSRRAILAFMIRHSWPSNEIVADNFGAGSVRGREAGGMLRVFVVQQGLSVAVDLPHNQEVHP